MNPMHSWPALLLAVAGSTAFADPHAFIDRGGAAAPARGTDTCAGGLRYDDGSYEGGVGYANAVEDGGYVMGFDLPAGFQAESVCLCWTRGEFSNGTAVDFDIVFYAADGVGPKQEPGFPGTFIARVPGRAEDVPEFGVDGVAHYRVALPPLPSGLPPRVFIGAEWQPFEDRQFFLCNDASETTPLNEAYSSTDGVEWSTVSSIRPTYRSLGTVVFGTVPPPAAPPQPVPLSRTGLWITAGLFFAGLLALRRRSLRRFRPGA